MSNPNALIIDDQPANLKVLGKLLEQQNATYLGITSSIGINGVIEQMPRLDAVFVDLELPGEPSYDQLLATLKSNPRLEQVPIIAYSVHVSEIDRTRNWGFDGFLGKPLNASDFPEYWQRILNGESVWVY